MNNNQGIGVLNEKSLHSALKEWYAMPGDRFEVPIEEFIIDIVRDNQLIEIQTGNFSALKNKLTKLVVNHHVRLVYPIAQEKWLLKLPEDNRLPTSRRKSPKHGRVEDIFSELVSFPGLVNETNFSLEVLLILEEETRRYHNKRGWRRRGWLIEERRLLEVTERHLFRDQGDYCSLLPENLPEPFTNQNLVKMMGLSKRLTQQMSYCLREMGCITPVGKKNRFIQYSRVPS